MSAAGGRQGDAHSIWVAPDGTPYGVNDKRTPDSKASVPQHLTAPASATIGLATMFRARHHHRHHHASCNGGPVGFCTR